MKRIVSFFLRNVPRKYLQLVSHVVLGIVAVFYRGNQVECPVCDAQFRKFLPYGRVGRPNALCPNCLSLERHRLLWIYLHRKTDFFTRPMKMLHIAPEHCYISRFEAIDTLDYITADIESPLAKVKMDIHQIPFEENEFDVIFCNHVLEHVRDDKLAMKEMLRVLKPSGWAILQVPFFPPLSEKTEEDGSITDPKMREQLYGQDDHVRKYGLDYADRIREMGFEVVEENFVRDLTGSEVDRYALSSGEIIYRATKPA